MKVRIEKVSMGEKSEILYRITRGGDRRTADSDRVVLFREELEEHRVSEG